MLGRRRAVAAVTAALAVAPAADARAAPGDLDGSFSVDGKVALAAAGSFVARAVAVQPDGRILVAGYSCDPGASLSGLCQADGSSSFRVARFTAGGAPDTEWGDGGVVTTQVGTGRAQAFDLLLQPDGRVVAGGVGRDGADRDSFALTRYEPDGALDRSFDRDGIAITRVGRGLSAISDLAAAPGGAIVAVGRATDEQGRDRVAVARYGPDGGLRGGFGAFGTAFAGATGYGYGLGAWIAPDAAVVTAGIAGTTAADVASYRTGVARITPTGLADTRFSGDGAAEFAVGSSSSFANAITGLPDGRWVTAGAATDPQGRQVMALLRGTARGSLDAGWGADGVALVRTLAGASASDLVRLEDGRVLAAGQAATGSGEQRFALARLDADGRLDPAFSGGMVTTAWARFPVARAMAAAVDGRGRAVLAGIGCSGGTGAQCTGGTAHLALARYLGDAPASDTRAPVLDLVPPPRAMRRRSLLQRGVNVRLGTDEEARVTVTLRSRGRTLARRELPFSTRRRALRLRPARGALPRRRSFTVTVVFRATDRAGNVAVLRRSVRIR